MRWNMGSNWKRELDHPFVEKNHARLMDEFVGYHLTSSQQKLVAELEDFLHNDSEHVFILKGYTGTGKDLILQGIVRYLNAVHRSLSLSAPTAKAGFWLDKIVGNYKTRIHSTIHSMIYRFDEKKEALNNNLLNKSRCVFRLRNNTDSLDHVYLISESSILSDVKPNGEYLQYGSGKLLQDLMEYIHPDKTLCNRKVIFIGDDTQLPPVTLKESPALTEKYFKDLYGEDFSVRVFQLTDVVGSQLKNLIVKNAIQIRQELERNRYTRLTLEHDTSTMIPLEEEELVVKYLDAFNKAEDDKPIILVSTKEFSKRYNSLIRKALFPDKITVQPGDWIMFTENRIINNHRVFNGGFAKILKVMHCEPISAKSKDGYRNLRTRYVELEFTNEYGEKVIAECPLLEDILDASGSIKPNEEWLEYLINNPIYDDAIYAQYGYSTTVHKAQGATWSTVFLDTEFYQNRKTRLYFTWLYTGITRARERLYFLNWSDIGPNLAGRISSLSQRDSAEIRDVLPSQDCLVEKDESQSLSDTMLPQVEYPAEYQEFLQNLAQEIATALSKLEITIKKIEHLYYRVRYTFTRGNSVATVDAVYNKKKEISSIQPIRKKGDDGDFVNEIEHIMNAWID